MIGSNHNFATVLLCDIHDPTNACVEDLDAFDGRIEITGMSDHIGVREVADDRIVFSTGERGGQCIGELKRTHFGFHVIRRDVGRRYQDAILSFECAFLAAIKKERFNMWLKMITGASLIMSMFYGAYSLKPATIASKLDAVYIQKEEKKERRPLIE